MREKFIRDLPVILDALLVFKLYFIRFSNSKMKRPNSSDSILKYFDNNAAVLRRNLLDTPTNLQNQCVAQNIILGISKWN